MHLLAAQAGALQQDGEAIDLGQSPGAIVFASAADSELALLAGAADRAGTDDLRLANLLRLSHHLSVDLWLENTVCHARLVVVRLLGGPSYWQYGIDELTALAGQGRFQLAILPGDANPDPILRDRSTIAPEIWTQLHSLFTAGGPDNADTILTAFSALAAPSHPAPLRGGDWGGGGAAPSPEANLTPTPFPRFGLWHPKTGMVETIPTAKSPIIPILFYRAALEGAGTATLEALVTSLETKSLTPVPILVSSLKEMPCVRFVQHLFAAHQPAVILNLTGFALGIDGLNAKQNPFAGTDSPVIQLVQSGRPEAQWAADIQGLSAKDLAMQLVLPELDGRIGGLIVGHKADAVWHARTQCPLSAYAPDLAGIDRATDLAANYARLRATPRADRRIAIILANYPIRDGRLANGVGYDAPQSTVEILQSLTAAGYRTAPAPSPPSPLRGGVGGGGTPQMQDLPIVPPDAATRIAGLKHNPEGVWVIEQPPAPGATPTPNPSPQGGGGGVPNDFSDRPFETDGATSPPSPLRGGVGGGGKPQMQSQWLATTRTLKTNARVEKNTLLARRLRHTSSPPERALWQLLRQFNAQGQHFRRQVPIGPYFVDFASHALRLVIELDGDTHATAEQQTKDSVRDAFLMSAGYRVMWLANRDVLNNPDGVWVVIEQALALASTPTPNPSPQGGGGRGPNDLSAQSMETDGATSPPSPLRGGVGGGGTPHMRAPPNLPPNAATLIAQLQSGPTNANPRRGAGIPFPLARYHALFATLPAKIRAEVTARWGAPEADPFVRGENFHLPALQFGNLVVLLQPARGYDRDDAANYHDPDLVPPHAYLAAYLWLRHEFGAHALIHNGKHGNLEWLPGKATALDAASYPGALWGQLPQFYPFIVNDPGEGTQAKRRTGATIIDHLVPPLTRAETYGPLKDLEALLDEYYAAAGMDRRRLKLLTRRILDFACDQRLDRDIAFPADDAEALKRIDTFLCDLKEAQIRDGLHVFGQSPTGRLERDLAIALARVPRGEGPGEASLIRALADDLKLGIDPLTADLGDVWTGPMAAPAATPTPNPSPQGGGGRAPNDLSAQSMETDVATSPPSPLRGGVGGGGTPQMQALKASPRTIGQLVDRLETLAAELLDGRAPDPDWTATAAVLETIETTIRPRLAASGPAEMRALLDGLDGKFVAPGPSGAPSRGRLDVLPTGRNFYSVDIRAVPTPTAWELGKKSAENLLVRHFQDHGTPLRSLALSVWGTANMRTGGDDIAQALAFIGAKPVWDPGSLRVSGYEIIPLAKLGRPRVDVTMRISGFFRDAFPSQIVLFDKAIRAIGALDEPTDDNPIAARMRTDALALIGRGAAEPEAALRAGHRIFGSKPGAYGAGLQGLIDSGQWQGKADLAEAVLNWGQYAYGAHAAGIPERERFAARLSDIDAVVHNQDNREHDLLDSDDYYQFEGGLIATAEVLTGRKPVAWHNDHSRPERPVPRTLEEEISKVVRSRVVNPKWLAGVMRHGYKGAFEIIATVDYMFAFAATTGAVKTHHFDLAFAAFVEDQAVAAFIRDANHYGWDELLAKFRDARERGFWTPRSNAAHALLTAASVGQDDATASLPLEGRGRGGGPSPNTVPADRPPPSIPPLKGEGDSPQSLEQK